MTGAVDLRELRCDGESNVLLSASVGSWLEVITRSALEGAVFVVWNLIILTVR